MSSPILLTRSELYDLHALNQDAIKSLGIGFLPPQIGRVVEKAALLGTESLDPDTVNALFADLTNRQIQDYFLVEDKKSSTD